MIAAECSVELKEWGEARKWPAGYRAAWPGGGPSSIVELMQRIESALDMAKDV